MLSIGEDSPGAPHRHGLVVLIIGNDPDDHAACIRTLRRIPDTNYRFEMAFDGSTGLQLIAKRAPDIVLLDYSLPGSSLEVLAKIRELRPFLPVIMLADQGNEALASENAKAGEGRCLSKVALAEPSSICLTERSGEAITLQDAITIAMIESQFQQTPAKAASGIHALLIDDNPDDREACVRALSRVRGAQYSFAEAVDGPSGLEAIASRTPDIVLLDYCLPGHDGLEVLRQIRESYPFLPVIILTGQGEALAVHGIKTGALDYIPKVAAQGDVLHRSIVAAIEHHQDSRTINFQSRTIERQREYLEHSNHFLNTLLDHIPDPIFVRDGTNRLLMANLAFRELRGESGRLAEDSDHAVLPSNSVDAFWFQQDLSLQHGEPAVVEQAVADQAGIYRLFSIKRATFTDRMGNNVLVGVMRDVSSQRQAEDDFKLQSTQLMNQSQDLASLGAILEDSMQELFIIDAATLLITKINKGARRNLGYSQQEMEHMSVLELSPQITERQLRKLLKPLETGEVGETVYHTTYRRRNGSLYEVEVHAQSTFFHGRNVFVQIALDETERNRVEQMKSEFISKVSHELRTPLTSIRGALGLVAAGALGPLPEKAATMVGIAHSNAERLARLVNDIMALEKSASGNLSLEIRETPVGELLGQAIESHAGYAERCKVRFGLEQVASDLSVMADALRLMQVLANLMSNAAKFSPAGTEVTVRAAGHGANVRFEVEDRGCGIPDDFRPLIFEKFAQADSSIARRFEGSGLGLSITKQLVEAMGGQVWFESEVGRGTTFFFELPQPEKAASRTVSRDNAASVLICEDDPEMALIIRLAIERAGLETTTVATIQEARQRLKGASFAVMTLGLDSPGGDGLRFLQELRIQSSTCGMPVVVVSAGAAEARQTFQGDDALLDWVNKPLDPQTLVQSVRTALLRSEMLPRLLYLGEDRSIGEECAHLLAGFARLTSANDLSDHYEDIRARRFALLIADPGIPKWRVKELLDQLGSGADGRPPVLLLSESDVDLAGRPGRRVSAAVSKKVSAILGNASSEGTFPCDR